MSSEQNKTLITEYYKLPKIILIKFNIENCKILYESTIIYLIRQVALPRTYQIQSPTKQSNETYSLCYWYIIILFFILT